jgi:hypothetical protein
MYVRIRGVGSPNAGLEVAACTVRLLLIFLGQQEQRNKIPLTNRKNGKLAQPEAWNASRVAGLMGFTFSFFFFFLVYFLGSFFPILLLRQLWSPTRARALRNQTQFSPSPTLSKPHLSALISYFHVLSGT